MSGESEPHQCRVGIYPNRALSLPSRGDPSAAVIELPGRDISRPYNHNCRITHYLDVGWGLVTNGNPFRGPHRQYNPTDSPVPTAHSQHFHAGRGTTPPLHIFPLMDVGAILVIARGTISRIRRNPCEHATPNCGRAQSPPLHSPRSLVLPKNSVPVSGRCLFFIPGRTVCTAFQYRGL
jgi:hypothetical protein